LESRFDAEFIVGVEDVGNPILVDMFAIAPDFHLGGGVRDMLTQTKMFIMTCYFNALIILYLGSSFQRTVMSTALTKQNRERPQECKNETPPAVFVALKKNVCCVVYRGILIFVVRIHISNNGINNHFEQ
jgi:hypothetical protein